MNIGHSPIAELAFPALPANEKPTKVSPLTMPSGNIFIYLDAAKESVHSVDYYLLDEHAGQGAFSLIWPLRCSALAFTLHNMQRELRWLIRILDIITNSSGFEYYLGAIVGAFVSGWAADRIGRVNGLFYAAIFPLIGGALQAATQSSNFILVAGVITGLGTGALTGITPVLFSEMSTVDHRGGFLGYVFIANYLGISLAYWISFGLAFINNGDSVLTWRFLLGFQCFPALLLLAGIKLLPDSPHYLATVGRTGETKDVLEHVRRGSSPTVEKEFLEICALVGNTKPSSPIEFARVLLGRSANVKPHLGRRAWLCVWLQIMVSRTGITAVTAYSPVLLKAASYRSLKQNGLAGGLNTIGIIGTIISAQIVNRLGRRKCLIGGAFGLFAVNIIAASLYEASRRQLSKGNGFGITGWAIGVGWTVLVNPIMFGSLANRTYFLFASLNLLWMPIVVFFYPETKDRSLESIDAMFIPRSPFYSKMEEAYRSQGDVLAARGFSVSAPPPNARKFSIAQGGEDEASSGSEEAHFEKV
ncbi:hypothetical protein OEA41_009644 [Lepraria neglecta]|uniref:Major facilitator superfamily (MFS) profile domain-containing protein n=1 Tax=Lepraria neglecta TaxID=209136 RepID=A0AAD9Z592_9LECA|nr:hypothetical protein OEA41_009644 [Lepraria neglecta]